MNGYQKMGAQMSSLAIGLGVVVMAVVGCESDESTKTAPDGAITTRPRDDGGDPPDAWVKPPALGGGQDKVERSRYLADLEFIAKERTPDSAHWMAVQDLCYDRFTDLGFETEREDYGSGVNVIGRLPGKDKANEQVIISAHYDHIPGCLGADDNASGVAGVLEAARVLAMSDHSRTLVVACWDEEETGAHGSIAYATDAKKANADIAVSFVLEMIGYKSDEPNSQTIPPGFDLLFEEQTKVVAANQNRGDFIALVGDQSAHNALVALGEAAKAIDLPAAELEVLGALKNNAALADLRRSDHAPFWAADYPAIMITDTA
ncbi:MAG: M20/M25/M40 family metallo-hydrolase, partial [Myxococcales bacterium]|nr:M20/M25/M40 family metallo-hydrolase [Myxococcales bacterium]